MHPSEVKLQHVTAGDLQSNPRGGKTAPLLVDGKQLRLKIRNCTTPFTCSSYDKTSTRRSLDVRMDDGLRELCTRLDAGMIPLAHDFQCKADGYTSLAKPQKEAFDPLFRMKLTLDDSGKTPVKFFDERRKRMTPEQIAAIEWRDVSMDINLSVASIYVNSGRYGCVATPQSILVRSQDTCEFSGGEDETTE